MSKLDERAKNTVSTKIEAKKNILKLKKIAKIVFVLGCAFVTTSLGSYFFHKNIVKKKIYDVILFTIFSLKI